MAKKEPLYAGQKVWLESENVYWGKGEKGIREMIVTKANKSSAYIWYEDDQESSVRYKVNQRTYEVRYPIPDGNIYHLWLSKEDYENNVEYRKKMKIVRAEAHAKVDKMSLTELEKFIG